MVVPLRAQRVIIFLCSQVLNAKRSPLLLSAENWTPHLTAKDTNAEELEEMDRIRVAEER